MAVTVEVAASVPDLPVVEVVEELAGATRNHKRVVSTHADEIVVPIRVHIPDATDDMAKALALVANLTQDAAIPSRMDADDARIVETMRTEKDVWGPIAIDIARRRDPIPVLAWREL